MATFITAFLLYLLYLMSLSPRFTFAHTISGMHPYAVFKVLFYSIG